MKLYFSGVAGKKEFEMLMAARVDHLLVDPTDLKHVEPSYTGHLALDSGAYRAFKSGKRSLMLVRDYYELCDSLPLDFAIMQDVIGDADETLLRWNNHFSPKAVKLDMVRFVPVWQWGAPRDHLSRYIDEAELVAIGGLVPLMREKDKTMYRDLWDICTAYPGRFHILGMNWLKCIEDLGGKVSSCDTSKFLDAGRYGHLLFKNTKTGHLSQAPAKVLGFGHLSREERIIESAAALRKYVEEAA